MNSVSGGLAVSSCVLDNLVVVFLLFWGTVGSSLPLVKVPRIWLQELGVQSTGCVCYLSHVMELAWWDVLLRGALSPAELDVTFSHPL